MQGPYPSQGAAMPPAGVTIPLGEESPSKPVTGAYAGGVYTQNYQEPVRPQPPQGGVYAMDGPPRMGSGAGVYAMSPGPNVPPTTQPFHTPGGGVYSTGLPLPQSASGATGLYAPNSPFDVRNPPSRPPAQQPQGFYGGGGPPGQAPPSGASLGYPVTPEQGGYRY